MIKIEPDNNDASSDAISYNTTDETHRQEVNCIQMEIKQELELILEPDEWVPSKIEDEQQEYYQHYQHKDDDNKGDGFMLPSIKPEPQYEENSVQNIDEEEYNEDDSNSNDYEYNKFNYEEEHDIDEDSECNDNEIDNSGYMDLLGNPDHCNEQRGTSNNAYNLEDSADSNSVESICKDTFLKWLCGNYIQHICPICSNKFENYRPWSKHINSQHQDMIDGAKPNFYINESSRAICKLCNKQFNMDFILLIHSLRHASQNTVKIFICNICDFESTRSIYILNHIMERHPHIEELFKTLKIETKKNFYECPLCPSIYKNFIHLRYHFLDSHQKELWEKFRYTCHICEDKPKFEIDEEFFKHLLEEHNLKDLKLLNFLKLSENPDEQYFSCTKCFKIFTEMNIIKLLKHFLEHDAKSYWLCKFCSRKFSFRYHSFYHVCPRMIKIYKKRIVNNSKTEENTPSSSASQLNQEKKKLSSWQEFEEYILHICPFCNKEFYTLQKWQMHLRKLHQIDTLKGLEMTTLAENPNKLQCKVCYTLVTNTSIQLHTHRFQHLPYKPYRCRHCSQTLNNYRIALAHVLNQCQDNKANQAISKGFVVVGPTDEFKAIRESVEISCSFCANKKFPDVPSILQHFEDKHNNFVEFFCQQQDNSMICNLCRHQFAVYDKNICISHIIQHLDQKTYKCLLCPQSYHTHKVCLSHLKRSHFAQAINNKKRTNYSLKKTHKARMACCTEKSTILNEFIEFITYACPECNESLENQQLWHDHINNEHSFFDNDNLGVKDPLDGLLKCQQCRLRLDTSLVQRQKHKLTHMPYRSFICNLCYHRCTSLGVLYGHLRRLHFSKGSYKCPICTAVSITCYERSEHIKKTHPQSEWPASMCLVCYKTLSSRNALSTHMITHDINRPKFECKYCAAKLCDMKDLKIHVARHEKSMPQTSESDQNNDGNSKTPIDNDITNNAEQKINNDTNTSHTEQIHGSNNLKANEILNTTDDVKVECSETSKSHNKNMIRIKKRKLIAKAIKTENKTNVKKGKV